MELGLSAIPTMEETKIMTRILLMVFAITALCGMQVSPAAAQSSGNWSCFDDQSQRPIELILSACSLAIDDPGTSMSEKTNALLTRGWIYIKLEKYDRAISDFTHAIGWQRTLSEAYLGRADAYEKRGDYSHAMADYDQLIEMHPHDSRAFNDRCWNRAVQGQQLELALSDCNQAVTLSPNDADILDSRCFVNFRMSQYSSAIGDCDAVLKIYPKRAPSLYVRGLAKLKTGDTAGGNADIAAAEALDSTVAQTYAGYGVKP